jgi:hypothetical protein
MTWITSPFTLPRNYINHARDITLKAAWKQEIESCCCQDDAVADHSYDTKAIVMLYEWGWKC